MKLPVQNDKITTPEKHAKLEGLQSSGDLNIYKIEVDVVIIGSGAGGSLAAYELSRAGFRVLMLEEGSYFHPGHFKTDEVYSLSRFYRDSGFQMSENNYLSVFQGKTLGGSTTVNYKTIAYPRNNIFDDWEKIFGISGYRENETQDLVDEIESFLKFEVPSEDLLGPNQSILLPVLRDLNLPFYYYTALSHKCQGLGRCSLGCPINAKQSMYMNYIPAALDFGAKIFTQMRVLKIEDGIKKRVLAEFVKDPHEPPISGTINRMEVFAKTVIVSAGPIESPALLIRSGLGNKSVGTNLKLHPGATVMGVFESKIDMHRGIPQLLRIDGESNSKYWIDTWNIRPSSYSRLLPYNGISLFNTLQKFSYSASAVVQVRDGVKGKTLGRVDWRSGEKKIFYELSPEDEKQLLMGIRQLCRIYSHAGAKYIVLPFLNRTDPLPVNSADSFDWILNDPSHRKQLILNSIHPHGSISLSSNSISIGVSFTTYNKWSFTP